MAKQQQPEPDDTPPPEPDDTLEQRVSGLESGQESLTGKVDHIIGMLSGGKRNPSPEPDQPAAGDGTAGGIAHEIRAQLDERDRKAAASKAEQDRDTTIADLKAQVAALTETSPEPVPRRVEKLMGWT